MINIAFSSLLDCLTIAESSIVPPCVGISTSKFLAPVINELERWKVKYEAMPMCRPLKQKTLEKSMITPF